MGQLGDAHEIVRIQLRDTVDQLVAVFGPVPAGGFVSDVVPHPARAGGKDGEVGAAFPLQLQLRPFEALPDLVVRDIDRSLYVLIQGVRGQVDQADAPELDVALRG